MSPSRPGVPAKLGDHPTLRGWHPKSQKLDNFKNPTDDQSVWNESDCLARFVWQLPVLEADGKRPFTDPFSFIPRSFPLLRARRLTRETIT
ncbi:hypothetical protein [Burkholderia ubonensis]|uniref:hypothetical protein n=1 Tax=Burkholderia ubonensis TaxID=101571 RepID=UPI0009B39384|nr:hypothetical protein [Burkholderia ubonensis]